MSEGPEHGITVLIPPAKPPAMPHPEVHHDPLQSQLPLQPQLCTQSIHPQPQLYPQQQQQQQPHAGPSSRAAELTVVYSHRGSPLHLSADSACSSSSLPGRGPLFKPPTMPQWGENVTLMSPALGWEDWQVSLRAVLHWGECARGQGWFETVCQAWQTEVTSNKGCFLG